MVRALGLAAVRAVAMSSSRERVMRAAHVAARRRGFSFRDRHGGRLQSERGALGTTQPPPSHPGGKTGRVVSRKARPVSSQKPGKTG